jgi:DNA-binding NarL/FixJ family response regulator
MTMPGMTGEETLAALRRVQPDVRVVLASGYSELEAGRRFASAIIDGFVQKPYTLETLAERMRVASAVIAPADTGRARQRS